MRYLAVFLACVICASLAQATVDSDPDQIGIYFDLNADQTSLDVVGDPYTIFSAYVIITNPAASAVTGIRLSWCSEIVGTTSGFLLGPIEHWYGEYSDSLDQFSWCDDGRQLVFYEPLPFVGSNVPVVRLEYTAYFGEPAMEFYLGPIYPQSNQGGLPAYRDADGVFRPLGISSGDTSLPVAILNGENDVVSTVDSTLDAIKAIYR